MVSALGIGLRLLGFSVGILQGFWLVVSGGGLKRGLPRTWESLGHGMQPRQPKTGTTFLGLGRVLPFLVRTYDVET